MKKTALKQLEEITSIGFQLKSKPIDPNVKHPWNVIFLLRQIILEQNQRLDELEYQIAEMKGQVEPD